MPGRHPPSAHRLRELRRRGDVPVSALTTRATALLLTALALLYAAPHLARAFHALARAAWARPLASGDAISAHLTALLGWLCVPLLAGFGGALLGGLAQTRFNLVLRARPSPFDVGGRLRELMSARALLPRLLSWPITGALLLAGVGVVAVISGALLGWSGVDGATALEVLGRVASLTAGVMLASLTMLAAMDWGLTRWLYRRAHRMTDAEIAREARQLRGPVERRQAQRRRAREVSRTRALEREDDALLLLAPRQEVAVMIAYRPPAVATPCVSALGQGARYRSLLRAASVPAVEVPDLARRLALEVTPGAAVPTAHHDALVDVMLEQGVGVSRR